MPKKKTYPAPCKNEHCHRVVGSAENSDKCHRCRRQWFKENHPIAYSWGNLKRRARQRGITFSLTLDEYTRFAVATDYASLKGKSSLSLSCDRIDGGLGYHYWNIRAITLAENSRKEWVPYFNGGKEPKHIRRAMADLERQYHAKLERIASQIGKNLQAGSRAFWKAFNTAKTEMLQTSSLT